MKSRFTRSPSPSSTAELMRSVERRSNAVSTYSESSRVTAEQLVKQVMFTDEHVRTLLIISKRYCKVTELTEAEHWPGPKLL